MITDKKNQHYIPKFYLRNFSYKANRKEIGVYNIFNEIYVSRGKLRTQGSKNFFYGKDGTIEESLANIEGELDQALKSIINQKSLPKKFSKEHSTLLLFTILTDVRNPVAVESLKNSFEAVKGKLIEVDSEVDTEKFVPTTSHEEIVKSLLSTIPDVINNTIDLDYKLLINKTNTPFISSDFPVIKYNQYLESKKWPHTKTGYISVGLQIFVPINSEIMLFLYDSSIYKVGSRKQMSITIDNPIDVNELNILQFINCFETIYFDEKASKTYIRDLHRLSKRYKRANQTKSELSFLFKDNNEKEKILGTGKKNFIIVGLSDCETNLKLTSCKIHSNGRAHLLDPSLAQIRKHPTKLEYYRSGRINRA